jgi:uncharacterized protein (UPF0548 family)
MATSDTAHAATGVEGLRDDRGVPLTSLDPGLAARLRRLELTYGEAGQTRGVLPAGYRHLRRRSVVGSGPQVFAAAVTMLLGWQVHLRAGLRVSPSLATAGPGAVVVLGLGAGPVRITAPCRVIYTVNEPDARGFAYGTLPGHPECGEEAFLVERHDDGAVTFTITAFSRPATLRAKAAGPAGRAIQRHITTRYLRALAG